MTVAKINKIAVFCGSHAGHSPIYSESAQQLADGLFKFELTLIYGGAKVGLMGAIADRMLNHKGHVIGVMPQSLIDVELAHPSLTELHIVNSMHERKELISEIADGFIMLPGGSGSLDEFFEMFTWAQLGYHSKPCGILNVNGYYDHLLKFLDNAVQQGFLKQVYRDMIIVDSSPQNIINSFMNYQAPLDIKWRTNTDSVK